MSFFHAHATEIPLQIFVRVVVARAPGCKYVERLRRFDARVLLQPVEHFGKMGIGRNAEDDAMDAELSDGPARYLIQAVSCSESTHCVSRIRPRTVANAIV